MPYIFFFQLTCGFIWRTLLMIALALYTRIHVYPPANRVILILASSNVWVWSASWIFNQIFVLITDELGAQRLIEIKFRYSLIKCQFTWRSSSSLALTNSKARQLVGGSQNGSENAFDSCLWSEEMIHQTGSGVKTNTMIDSLFDEQTLQNHLGLS